MKELAEKITSEIMGRLEPEIHKAMVERIIAISLDKWRFDFEKNEIISALIGKGMDAAIETTYKPVLDYIADRKAREKVMRRAKQNGIKREETEQLMLSMGVK